VEQNWMSESPDALKVTRWIESELGARVLRVTRQPRWRPVWFVEAERGGERQTFVVRGERLDARIGFTLQQEMTLQRLLHEAEIPVAAVHGWVDDPRAYVMDFVAGEENFVNTRPAERDAVMDQYMETLAKIHALDVAPFADAGILRAPEPAEAGRVGMRVYEKAYRAVKKRPDPFLEFTLGWLRRNPAPAPHRESVVLWDTGQLLHGEGQLRALIDLEIGHIGDPMMDLAGFRMRGAELGIGDFDRLYRVYAERGGEPLDWQAIRHHYFSFALCNQLAFHAALAEPPAGSDYMMNLRWCLETNLYAIEAMAEMLGVTLEAVPALAPRVSSAAVAHRHGVAWLRNFDAGDEVRQNEVRSAFRLARHLARMDELGACVEAADLEDLGELLGTRPADGPAGDAALEEFVLADNGQHDTELVSVFYRRLQRALQTLGPEGSAIARHNPVAPFPEIDAGLG
jgi:aminoglycoside phosphotransferase (APT) family kinase protein